MNDREANPRGGETTLRAAAVLIPIFRDPRGMLRVVLIRRSAHGTHGGQIALPGGRRDPDDDGPVATALREAEEEIGLPPERVDVLEVLPEFRTSSTGFTIVPVLGRIRPPKRWRPDPREVAEVVEMDVADLALAEARGEALDLLPGWAPPRPMPFVRVGDHRMWGVTYRILDPLISRLLAGEWPI